MITRYGRLCFDGLLTRRRQPCRFATGTLLVALESAWTAIRTRHPDVPRAVLIVASGTAGHKDRVLGHFAALRWQHGTDRLPEVLISAEGLRRGPADVFTTLLHEAVHGIADTRTIKDTSRQGRWHNQRYATLATELGLTVARTSTRGWSDTTLPEGTAACYRDTIAALSAALTAYRHPQHTPTVEPKTVTTLVCECDCGRSLRLPRKTHAAGPVLCGLCDSVFQPDDDPDDQNPDTDNDGGGRS